jgi:hypothetical protein
LFFYLYTLIKKCNSFGKARSMLLDSSWKSLIFSSNAQESWVSLRIMKNTFGACISFYLISYFHQWLIIYSRTRIAMSSWAQLNYYFMICWTWNSRLHSNKYKHLGLFKRGFVPVPPTQIGSRSLTVQQSCRMGKWARCSTSVTISATMVSFVGKW